MTKQTKILTKTLIQRNKMNEQSLTQILGQLPTEQAKELAEQAVKESFEVGTRLGSAISDLIDAIFE